MSWVLSAATYAGMEISEFMAKNDSTFANAAGEYSDWVEIHNASGEAVDLAGWYLTDDITDLRKWQFPSTGSTSSLADDGYLLIFMDDSVDSIIGNELHAGFKLGAGGEYLALIEPDGETVAYQYAPTYPDQSAEISYGIDSGTGEHAYFSAPTPGSANGQAIADVVQFSVESHAFTDPFSLILSVASPSADIRYTVDGSIPTSSSLLYNTPLTINSTTQVRARTFESGLEDGAVVCETYYHLDASIAGFSSDLPLVVIDNFGAGEVPHPDSPIRQPAQVLFFEPNAGTTSLTNAPSISTRAGIRRRGESSLRNTGSKPNLSLETWGTVDEDSRSIKPFGMPSESDWILTAPWTIDKAMMRNSFIYEVSNEAGRYAVRTRFVEVFLNYGGGSIAESDYYGVYEFMEKIKVGKDRVDIAELTDADNAEPEVSGGYIWKRDKAESIDDPNNFAAAGQNLPTTAGDRVLQYVSPSGSELTAVQKDWFTNHLNTVDAAIPDGNYGAFIDEASFADHHIINVFANNADGLSASTFYHKDRNGLLNMGPIWDFDRSMGCDNDLRASDPETWSLASDAMYFFHSGGPLWFREFALNDPDFWMVWVDRWQLMREGPLSEAAMTERIERYRSELSNAAVRNYNRWSGVLNATNWSDKVDVFKNHVLTRGQWIDEQLVDPPVLSHDGGLVPSGFQLNISGLDANYFTLDGSDPRAAGGSPSGTLYGAPITITENSLVKARAWNGQNFVNAPSTWPWSAKREAIFVVDPAPLAITEIMYHPRPPLGTAELAFTASDFEFIEIQNISASACSLVGVRLLDGVEFDFTYGNNVVLGAGAYGLVVRNLEAFKVRYANWASLNILGEYEGRLSDSTEEVELGYVPTNMARLAIFDYEDDWYPCTDGEGFSLVLKDAQSAPSSWDAKTAWRHSSGIDGSPGEADPASAYVPGTVVINEVLSHQDADNPDDWIELHNTTDGPINIGGWFLSDSRGNLQKYEIPAGTIIPANGYTVFTEYSHFGSAFALSEHGDSVYLSSGSGGSLSEPAYRENVSFGGQERDVTFGRHVRSDGSVTFPTQAMPSMGATNSAPAVGPIGIEEIMYHPPVGGHEYIKLRNASGSTVNLYDTANPSNVWKVSGIDFKFPMGTQLDAGESLLLVRDTITPESFRPAFGVPASISILNYDGKLENDADTLVLKKPGKPETGTGYVPYIVVEEVKYNDSAPWPLEADGTGKSLGRIDLLAYANDVANWQAVGAGYIPKLYSVSVHDGSGSGTYTPGTLVPLVTSPQGQTFIRWIGNVSGVADVLNPSTFLTVPEQDITITALYSFPVTLIPAGTLWKYHDQGKDLGTAWRMPGYDDSSWTAGAAKLGYNNPDTVTVVDFGPDQDNKYPTTYFRKQFHVDDVSTIGSLTLDVLRDDGVVVYLNGAEVVRDNMPAGNVDYLTYAITTIGGAAESTFYPFEISPDALISGTNVLAVELHQKSATSSDLSLDVRLVAVQMIDRSVQDGDADGLYDAWETNYFGSTENALPAVDPDGDGFVNSNEFIAGTLPEDAESYFRIDGFDGADLSWSMVSGRIYSVDWTGHLGEPFVPVADRLEEGHYSTARDDTHSAGYYRINVRIKQD
ncbi:lamin tail domain-containing protein [Pontiella desulfatans]|nr:lamin tail domain-containing protein [Pontiella desulfatans]